MHDRGWLRSRGGTVLVAVLLAVGPGCTEQPERPAQMLGAHTAGLSVQDTTPPAAFDLLAPIDNFWVNSGNVSLSWSSSADAESGLASYQVLLSGPKNVTLSPGLATSIDWPIGSVVASYDFSSLAQAGNWDLRNTWTFGQWDGRSALISDASTYGPSLSSNAALLQLVPLTARSSVSFWVAYDFADANDYGRLEIFPPPSGPWTPLVTFTGSNVSGTHENISLAAYANKTVQLRFHLSSDASGFGRGLAVDDFVVGDAVDEGSYTWQVVAADNAGNEQASSSTRTIGVDRTAPSVPDGLHPGNGDGYVGTATPTLSWNAATDSAAGVCNYQVTLDGSALPRGSATSILTSTLSSGSHSWTVSAIDCAGNESSSATTQTFSIDLTPPAVVSLVAPDDNTLSTVASPTLTWTTSSDAASGVCGYIVTVDGSDLPLTGGTAYNAAFGDGPHAWTVRVRDCAGNESAKAPVRTFTIDTTGPSGAQITSPTAGSFTANARPEIDWSAASDSSSSIAYYQLTIDDQPSFNVASTETSYVQESDFSSGQHCVSVMAVDILGNAGAPSEQVCFGVDRAAPSVPGTLTPSSGHIFTDARGSFSWGASDDGTGAGVCGYIPVLDGADLSQQVEASFSSPDDLSEGNHTWTVRAIDCVGNQSANAATHSFKVDLSAPSAPTLSAPIGGVFLKTGLPTLSWAASSDGVSGLCGYVLQLDGTDHALSAFATSFVPTTPLSDGVHGWTVDAVDCVGFHSGFVSGETFFVDLTGPNAVSVTAPPAGAWLGQNEATAEWSAVIDEGSGLASYRVKLDSQPVVTVNAPATSLGLSNLIDGQHCVTVSAVDELGNIGEAGHVCFKVDLTPPSVPGSLAPAGNTHLGTALPSLSWAAATDGGSGVCGYIPTVDGVELPQQTATNLTPAEALSEGTHSWTVRAVDCVGHAGLDAAVASFDVDLSPPGTVTLVAPVAGVFLRDVHPQLSWTSASDAGSGVCDYIVSLDNVDYALGHVGTTFTPAISLSHGQHAWTVRAVDCLGHVAAAASEATFFVDTVAPSEPTIVQPTAAEWLNDTTPDITWEVATDDGSGVAAYLLRVDSAPSIRLDSSVQIFTPPALGEGQHCVLIAAVDLVGNTGGGAQRCFSVDVSSPVLLSAAGLSPQGVVGPDWAATPTLTFGSWSDFGGSGVCGYQATFDGATLPAQSLSTLALEGSIAEGSHDWSVRAVDCVGNEAMSDASFVLDLTPPTVPQPISPTGSSYSSNAAPTLVWSAATDDVAGLKEYVLTVDRANVRYISAAQTQFTLLSALGDGLHAWHVQARDAVGNLSEASPDAIFGVDTTGPDAVSFQTPAEGAVLGTTRPEVRWSAPRDAGAGVASYLVALDSGTAIPSADTSFTPGTNLSGGSHCVTVRAVDALSNIGAAATRCFQLDLTGPTTPTLQSPADSAYVNSTPTLSWTAAADAVSGVCSYVVTLDGNDQPAQTTTSFAVSVPLTDGAHTWTARAIDCAGNVGAAPAARTLLVDLTPPTPVTLVSPARGAIFGGSMPTLVWQLTVDAGAGVCGYVVSIDATTTQLAATRSALAITDTLSEGSHTWNVVAVDCAGNSTTPNSPGGQFFVDATPPTEVTFTAPAAGAWLSDGRPTTSWTASNDALSGVAAYIVDSDDGQTTLEPGTTSITPLGTLTDGEHCVRVRVQDRAGNISVGARNCFHVDRTAPDVPAAQAPTGGIFVGAERPTCTWAAARDTGAGVCSYRLTFDTLPAVDVTGTSGQPAMDLSEGLHSWSVAAVDCAGNVGFGSTPAFFRLDLTGPTGIDFTYPSEGEWLNTAHPLLVWSEGQDSASGLIGYRMSIDMGRSLAFVVGQSSYSVADTLGEGMHCAVLHGLDHAGRTSEDATRCFGVDLSAPAMTTLTFPAADGCAGAKPTLQWTTGEDALSGVATVGVSVDARSLGSNLAATETSLAVRTALASGPHSWSVAAQDKAGNISTATASFSVDTAPPSCALRSVALASGSLQVTGTAMDTGCAGVATVEVILDDQGQPAAATLGTDGTWTATLETPQNGVHHLNCRATDAVGLIATSAPYALPLTACFAPGTCDANTHSCGVPQNGAQCDDGDPCTSGDICGFDGRCLGTPVQTVECGAEPDAGPVDAGSPDAGAADGGKPVTQKPSCGCSGQGPAEGIFPALMLLVLVLRRRSLRVA